MTHDCHEFPPVHGQVYLLKAQHLDGACIIYLDQVLKFQEGPASFCLMDRPFSAKDHVDDFFFGNPARTASPCIHGFLTFYHKAPPATEDAQ